MAREEGEKAREESWLELTRQNGIGSREGEELRRTKSRRAEPRCDAPCDPEVELDERGEESEDAGEVSKGFSNDGST